MCWQLQGTVLPLLGMCWRYERPSIQHQLCPKEHWGMRKFKKRKIITAREVWIHLFEVKQVCETQCLYVIKLLRSWRKIIEFEMDPIQFIECCNVFDVLIMSRSLAVWWFCIWSSWNCFSGEIRYICEVWNLEALGGIASFKNQLNYFHLPKTFIEVLFKKQSKYFPTSQTLITKRIIHL